MDISVKTSIRNFFDVKPSLQKEVSLLLDTPTTSNQLTVIVKVMEEAVKKFTKRYLIISAELEEMKREFTGETNLVNDYISLSRKNERSALKSIESLQLEQKQSIQKVKKKKQIDKDKERSDIKRTNNDSKISEKGKKEIQIPRMNSPNLPSHPRSNRHYSSESKVIKKVLIKNLIQKEKPKDRESKISHSKKEEKSNKNDEEVKDSIKNDNKKNLKSCAIIKNDKKNKGDPKHSKENDNQNNEEVIDSKMNDNNNDKELQTLKDKDNDKQNDEEAKCLIEKTIKTQDNNALFNDNLHEIIDILLNSQLIYYHIIF